MAGLSGHSIVPRGQRRGRSRTLSRADEQRGSRDESVPVPSQPPVRQTMAAQRRHLRHHSSHPAGRSEQDDGVSPNPFARERLSAVRGDFGLSERITHDRLSRLCFIAHGREMALVAETDGAESMAAEIIAVGRLSRLAGTRDAEYSMLVTDRYQRQGLGSKSHEGCSTSRMIGGSNGSSQRFCPKTARCNGCLRRSASAFTQTAAPFERSSCCRLLAERTWSRRRGSEGVRS